MPEKTPHQTSCSKTSQHQAHMAINASCPWCGYHDPTQTEFMSVEEAVEVFG